MNEIILKIVELTNGFSGAEMVAITNRDATLTLKRHVSVKSENLKDIKITSQDLLDSIDKVKPRKKDAPTTQSIQ